VKVSDFIDQISIMESNLKGDYGFRPDNVYQEGSPENREIIGRIIDYFLLPGSRINNSGALKDLFDRCRNGESCLILGEHYSNLDYPVFYRLVEKDPLLGPEIARSLLPIRGMKLSEATPVTAVYTRSYDTIIIYPSRSLDNVKSPQELEAIRKISVPINHAAMREMINRKHNGRIVLVFPAGTRYRHWDPGSARGVREIHSYVKTFDNIMFLGINGNALPPNESDDMTKDLLVRDLMILTCSDVTRGREFRKRVESSAPDGADTKQLVVDEVMNELAAIHTRVESGRLEEKNRL